MDLSMMRPGEEGHVIDLVKAVFDAVVAPGYTQEGIDEFYRFANVASLSERSKTDHFTVLARKDRHLIGIIEIRDFSHVSMFFVGTEYQGRGVGRALFDEAVRRIEPEKRNIRELTVNSSLNAVPAYEKLGFAAQGAEQCVNGIIFVPMKLTVDREPL